MSFFEDLSQLDVSKFNDNDIATLISLCNTFHEPDFVDKFLMAIRWALTRVNDVSALLPALNDFYNTFKVSKPAISEFYQKFKQLSEKEYALFGQLYGLAAKMRVHPSDCGKDANININLLGEEVENELESFVDIEREIDVKKLIGDWRGYYNLFEFRFLFRLKIESEEDEMFFLEKMKSRIQVNPTEVLYYASLLEQFKLVRLIIGMTFDDELDKTVVMQALYSAARNGNLSTVWLILKMTGDTKLSNDNLEYILKEVAEDGDLRMVQLFLFHIEHYHPNDIVVGNVLKSAASGGQLDIVKLILAMTGDNKPKRISVDAAFKLAVACGHVDIVQFYLTLTGDNKPSSDAIDFAVYQAAKDGRDSILFPCLEAKRSTSQSVVSSLWSQPSEQGSEVSASYKSSCS